MILWIYFLQLYFGPSEMEHPGVKEYVSSLSVSFVKTKCQWNAKFLICHL